MSSRQSSPLIDLAAVGDRLRRWRQWQQLSQAALARRAEVDSMVIARLEQQHKPRLEVETAAKLAHVLGWTLDQFCGLAPAPDIPDVPPPRPYNPLEDGRPAWLPDHVATSRV